MDTNHNGALEAGMQFAETRLGPGSARLMAHPEGRKRVLEHVEAGFRVKDAVLAEVHRGARTDRAVADEFVAYFLQDMLRVGSGALRAGLRRYLDTGDLVQSVLGDLWSDLEQVEFESRARFVGLLGRRLSWKAAEHARRMDGAARREDRRSEQAVEELDPAESGPGPGTRMEMDEEAQRMVLVLHRLGERDRRLVEWRLRGVSSKEIAEREGLSLESAQRAMTRSVERARELARGPA